MPTALRAWKVRYRRGEVVHCEGIQADLPRYNALTRTQKDVLHALLTYRGNQAAPDEAALGEVSGESLEKVRDALAAFKRLGIIP